MKVRKAMKKLYQRYINNECTKEELLTFFEELREEESNDALNSFMQKHWHNMTYLEDVNQKKFKTVLDEIHHQIGISESARQFKNHKIKKFNHILSRIAAIMFLPLLVVNVWYSFDTKERTMESTTFVSKAPEGQYSKVILPDSSVVWLNSESQLRYRSDFGKNERRLELQGEGFFSVAKNPDKPFKVYAKGQVITALGTRFNVSAYEKNSFISVILETGSVELKNDIYTTMIKPGEMAQVDVNNQIRVIPVNVSEYIDWHEGMVRFKEESLMNIVMQLEQQFGIKIIFGNKEIKDYKFRGSYNKNQPLKEILDLICLATGLSYEHKEQVIYLTK